MLAQGDAAAVLATASKVGWAMLAVVAVRAAIVVLAALGWAPLVTAPGQAGVGALVLLRFIREAVNVLLPVATVGGDLLGGRLLTWRGVRPGVAGASILSDLLIQSLAQLAFTVLGVQVLAASGRGGQVVAWVVPGLVLAALALAGFFSAQRLGLFRLLEAGLAQVARRWPATSFGGELNLHDNLRAIYRRPGAVLRSLAFHLAAWLLGTLECYVALLAMDQLPSLAQALAIESLGQAIRGAAFPVPGALGVQEGGFVLLGSLYGIGPEAGLALSFIKRVPDVVLGLPGLLAWYVLEKRRFVQPLPAFAVPPAPHATE